MDAESRAAGKLHRIVSDAHRRLDELFREVEATFAEPCDPDAARDAFAALSESLDVHFEQEDRLYYAPLRSLRPELAPQVRAISDAHRAFRSELAAIRAELERGPLLPARSRLAAFAQSFGRHEALEEELLRRVEAAAEPAAPPQPGS